MNKKKVGLFFGTFDPIHNGHIKIAEYITKKKLTDEVWLIVTPENPIKLKSKISNFKHRFNMARIATEKHENIMPSDLEISLKKPNYTIDTLEYISNKLKEIEFSLIIGEDNYKIFDTWKDYEKILERVRLLVAQRKADFTLPAYLKSKAILVEHELMTISSTDLRGKLQTGEPLDEYLHATTIDYISKHNLYR